MIKAAKLLAMAPDALAFVVAAGCLIAAAAGQGGRFSARLDVLNHFAPIWLAGSLAALAYAMVFGGPPLKWGVAGIGLTGAIAAAALILPEFTRPIRPPVAATTPRQITLIQFNGWDQNADASATADWIVAQKPDFVLMQEVRAPIRDALIGRGLHYQRGLAHTGLFSNRAPIANPFVVPKGDWKRLPDFARATFETAGGPFSVVAVHLVWPTRPIQRPTMAVLAELLGRYPQDRLIVAGDFNLTPWSFTLQGIDQRLGLERRDRALFSWPARISPGSNWRWPIPVLPIDHIYAGRAWRTVSITRGPSLGSDHYPIIARLALVD